MPYMKFAKPRTCPTCKARKAEGYYNPRTDRWDKQCADCSRATSARKRERIRAAANAAAAKRQAAAEARAAKRAAKQDAANATLDATVDATAETVNA